VIGRGQTKVGTGRRKVQHNNRTLIKKKENEKGDLLFPQEISAPTFFQLHLPQIRAMRVSSRSQSGSVSGDGC
jgi:hypothetical protein